MMCVTVLLALSVYVVATRADQTTKSQTPSTQPTLNPHWKADGCDACHDLTVAGRAEPIAPDRVDAICLKCHDGLRAPMEVHPIGRTFESEQVENTKNWPTVEGELGCLSCHEFAADHYQSPERPGKDPAFVRGYDGGSLQPFCAKCHVASAQEGYRYNPHLVQVRDGQVDRRSCRLCHTRTFDQAIPTKRTGEPGLRGDEMRLCADCHHYHMDYFTPGHIGTAMPPGMRTRLIAYEQNILSKKISAIETNGRSSVEPQLLRLADGHRMVCSTCHNPHQRGVFAEDSLLAAGSLVERKGETPLPLRGLKECICRACHQP
jgi:hypothetical protein